jgi:chemotaxis protein MotA
VGAANIVFLPAGNKLKLRLQHTLETKELILEGVVGILEGLNPKLIRSKLEAFEHNQNKSRQVDQPKVAGARARAAAAQ